MSETETTETVETPDAGESPETVEKVSPERLPDDHPLVKALDAQKAANKELKAKAAKLDEIENAQKSELQKALERAEAAEKRANTAEFESLRSRVAASKGVPASALTGTTEEELTAAADALIEWRGKAEPKPEPGKRPNPENLKSGVRGSDVKDADPKVAAVEALRRFRSDR